MSMEAAVDTIERDSLRGETVSEAPLATLLARAFRDYPLLHWLLGPRAYDKAAHSTLFRIVLGVPGAEKFKVERSADGAGVAIWLSATDLPLFSSSQARKAFWLFRRELGKDVASRLVQFYMASERWHPEFDYDYLFLLGVEPVRQGQGVGSAMLANHFRDSDRKGRCTMLETSDPANLLFYKRLGYEVIRQYVIAIGAPPTWVVARNP